MAAVKEAIRLWHLLAQSDPDQYQETYNRQLADLRRYLGLIGQETASIWLHLADQSPDPGRPARPSDEPDR
jgi:hypothetical protein